MIVLAYPGPPNNTMRIVARDTFLEIFDNLKLLIHVLAQKPTSFESAVRVAQHMEAMLQKQSACSNCGSGTRICEGGWRNQRGLGQSRFDVERFAGTIAENYGNEWSVADGRFQATRQGRSATGNHMR